MVLELRPIASMSFPPADSTPYPVKTGDDWGSVAKANSMDTWDLIEFNFPAVVPTANFNDKCKQVNWLLREHVGCTKSTDGKNYAFDSSDTPGIIYLPKNRSAGGRCAHWKLTSAEKEAILDIGGKAMLEWAEKKPTARAEAKEFKPRGHYRKDFKVIMGWKSCDPRRTCIADTRRQSLQFIWFLHDDEEYWDDRTKSKQESEIRRTSQEALIRDYRDRVIGRKQCPVGAQLALSSLGKSLILTMIWGLIHIIPTPGIPGSPVVRSVGALTTWISKFVRKYVHAD